MAALEKLENIDSETDNLDITFVKMADSRYAKKWGVTKLPAMVYFRRRFPSIYRGKSRSEASPAYSTLSHPFWVPTIDQLPEQLLFGRVVQ